MATTAVLWTLASLSGAPGRASESLSSSPVRPRAWWRGVRTWRAGSADGATVQPLCPSHGEFVQDFEQLLEKFGDALEVACTQDKGGLLGGGPSKKAHLKPDRVAMQQAYNHLYERYKEVLVGAATPQRVLLGSMQACAAWPRPSLLLWLTRGAAPPRRL